MVELNMKEKRKVTICVKFFYVCAASAAFKEFISGGKEERSKK